MEVVLLWLDELDDLLTLSAAAIDRIRLGCLKAGWFAALPIPLLDGRPGADAGPLAAFVSVCLVVWCAALLVRRSVARRTVFERGPA